MIISVRLRPITSRIASRLSGARLTDDAVEQRVLAQGQPVSLPKAISLPNQSDRIIGFPPAATRQQQESNLHRPFDENGPTIIYRYKNILLTPAGFYSRRQFSRRPEARREINPYLGRIEEFADGFYITSTHIERYFGHWIHDASPQEQLAKDIGVRPIMSDFSRWRHVGEYRDLGRLPQPIVPKGAVFQSIWIADDRHLNPHRIARLQHLRDQIVSETSPIPRRGVFLKRGISGSRDLVNEAQIIETMTEEGFSILDPEKSTAREIVQELAGARLVVSIEGSAVCHTLLSLPKGAGLVVIQPADHFNAHARIFAGAMGHYYSYTIADKAEGGYIQNIGELLQTIDLIETAMESRRGSSPF